MKQFSFPKEKIKILLLENLHSKAIDEFQNTGYTQIESLKSSPSEDEIIKKIQGVRILGIRSKTYITPKIIQNAPQLMTIGAFCIGTNQIHIDEATWKGIPVFNSPYSNTRSVAELVIGLIIVLIRKVFEKSTLAQIGFWDKDSQGCFEVRNKTLGIIGYGHIGSQVSVLAESLGMKVIFYDIEPKMALGNAQGVKSLNVLLRKSDIVTLHVPENNSTLKMIGKKELKLMKKGAILLNIARGKVLDSAEVAKAVIEKHLAGLAVDVFENEPRSSKDAFVSIFQKIPNVILTPHIGGSTEEAQENIAIDVVHKIINYLDKGTTLGSLTVPEINLPMQHNVHRFLHIHKNTPGVLSEINRKLSALNCNILGQYLKTNEKIGYVVLDIDKGTSSKVLSELNTVKNTIRTRCLY